MEIVCVNIYMCVRRPFDVSECVMDLSDFSLELEFTLNLNRKIYFPVKLKGDLRRRKSCLFGGVGQGWAE